MFLTCGSNNGKTIATTVTAAKICKKFSIPTNADIGAAIARPIGLNIIEPMASKDATRERDSRGTLRCNAVYHNVPHKSKVIPNKKAPKAINKSDCER